MLGKEKYGNILSTYFTNFNKSGKCINNKKVTYNKFINKNV